MDYSNIADKRLVPTSLFGGEILIEQYTNELHISVA